MIGLGTWGCLGGGLGGVFIFILGPALAVRRGGRGGGLGGARTGGTRPTYVHTCVCGYEVHH